MDKAVIVQTKMEQDTKFLEQCLLTLYAQQEEDERHYTSHLNGRGFNKGDSYYLGAVAREVTKYGYMAPVDVPRVRNMLTKYTTQLTRLIPDL